MIIYENLIFKYFISVRDDSYPDFLTKVIAL